jgi:hypothetical protein
LAIEKVQGKGAAAAAKNVGERKMSLCCNGCGVLQSELRGTVPQSEQIVNKPSQSELHDGTAFRTSWHCIAI